MKTIVTLTMNPSVDKSCSVDTVLADCKLRCSNISYEPGGGGINVSRAIHRLGGDSIAAYPFGCESGERLNSLLTAEGVAQLPVEINQPTRENLNVYEESTGRQFRFGMPGPDLSEREGEICLSELDSCPRFQYLVASGSLPRGIPVDFYARVARAAKGYKARCVVDCGGEALRHAAEEGVFMLKPNLRELQSMTDKPLRHHGQLKEACTALRSSGCCEVLVVSLGAGGVILVTQDQYLQIPPPIVPIRSKVGAGDSLVAGIVLSLAQGHTLEEAVQYGVAAGAAAVMSPGTQLCNAENTQALYEQYARNPSPESSVVT